MHHVLHVLVPPSIVVGIYLVIVIGLSLYKRARARRQAEQLQRSIEMERYSEGLEP